MSDASSAKNPSPTSDSESAVSAARSAAAEVARSPKERYIQWMARVGYAAKGIVYLLIGTLTTMLAFTPGKDAVGPKEALQMIADSTLTRALLGAVGVGLIAYSLWRWFQAAMDPENKGSDAKGLAQRGGYFCSGLAYFGIAVEAFRLMQGYGSGGGDSAEHWTGKVLGLPFGAWLVGIAAACVAGAGLYQFYRAYSAKFMKHLKRAEMSAKVEQVSKYLGRAGFAARGVVYLIIAGFLVDAAAATDAERAGGIGQALSSISNESYGPYLLCVVAIGLAAYGVFSLFVLAPYRRVLGD